jgi:GNAT superfamily N-acetyltransferase
VSTLAWIVVSGIGMSAIALVVRSDQHRRGLGQALLAKMIQYVADRGAVELVGQVMTRNHVMLGLVSKLGFVSKPVIGEPIVEVRLPLKDLRHRRQCSQSEENDSTQE